MSSKSIIWLGMIVGSTAGSFIPSLWGSGVLSYSSLLFSTLGGVAGIWLGFKLSR
ncbi:MAG: hypothetical protein HY093_04880 [Candidatus Liptonbacteria bacterium]|nr:hypothetical protein [Candidatus Liptonbacteria bacterium]